MEEVVVDPPVENNEAVVVTDPPAPTLTDEQVMKFLKGKGINADNFDTLKAKAEYQIPAPDPTDEQKKAEELAKEKRLLDLHMVRGGSVEQFAAYKQLVSADAKALGIEKTKNDLEKAGFTPEQADTISKQMHFDIADEELEGIDDDEKAFKLKLKEYGQSKHANRGQFLQNAAKSYLDSLNKEAEQLDGEKALKEQHASNVEDALKNFQRKQQISLGKIDDQDIDPFDYEIPEAVITQSADFLKDADKLDQTLFKKDGSVNLDVILPLVIKANAYDSAIKTGYLTGADRQVKHFESKFSSTPPKLGGPNPPEKSNGKFVSKGKPVTGVSPQNN